MSTTIKVILGVIAGLVIACIALAVGGAALLGWTGAQVAKVITTSPQQAEQMAAEVAEFDLPTGYQAQYGIRAIGVSVSSYTTADPSQHLFIAQAGQGSNLDAEDVQRMVSESQPNPKAGSDKEVKVVREEELTVRGKPARLIVSEAINSEQQPYRTMTVLFEGKGGPALVSISSPTATWDEEAATAFIASIR